jgi:hypothetical protein
VPLNVASGDALSAGVSDAVVDGAALVPADGSVLGAAADALAAGALAAAALAVGALGAVLCVGVPVADGEPQATATVASNVTIEMPDIRFNAQSPRARLISAIERAPYCLFAYCPA